MVDKKQKQVLFEQWESSLTRKYARKKLLTTRGLASKLEFGLQAIQLNVIVTLP